MGEKYQEFNFAHLTFEITYRHTNRYVKLVAGDLLEFRKDVWRRHTNLGAITLYVLYLRRPF